MNQNQNKKENSQESSSGPHQQEQNLQKVELIKQAVNNSFEELSAIESVIVKSQKIKSSLKRDITDLKEGRLDRIEERHKMDPDSKAHSVFTVEKKVIIGSKETNQWYIPFLICFRDQSGEYVVNNDSVINNSMTRINASGSYKLKNGEMRFL